MCLTVRTRVIRTVHYVNAGIEIQFPCSQFMMAAADPQEPLEHCFHRPVCQQKGAIPHPRTPAAYNDPKSIPTCHSSNIGCSLPGTARTRPSSSERITIT